MIDTDKFKALLAAASKRPWYTENCKEEDMRRTGWGINIAGSWDMVLSDSDPAPEENAALIVALVNSASELIEEIERLRSVEVAVRKCYEDVTLALTATKPEGS